MPADAQLAHLPPVGLYEAQTIDGRIRIAAETDTRSMSRIDPARQAIHDRARHPIRKAASQKRWVLTQYPTAGYAADAGMSLEAYEAFVARAMFLDRPDPVEAWRELGRRQAGLVEFMSGVEDGPDRGRRDRPDALGRRPDLDQLRRPPQHALRRDLHRPGRGQRERPAALRVPGLPRRPGGGRHRAGVRGRTGRLGAGRGGRGVPAFRCSTSTPAPAGSASWGSA